MTLTLEVFCRSSIFVFEGDFNYIDEGHTMTISKQIVRKHPKYVKKMRFEPFLAHLSQQLIGELIV